MAERDNLLKTKIKHYNNYFDFKELYRVSFEYLMDQGWDMNEKAYKESLQAGGAKEIEVEWEATRKVSDYFKYYMKIRFHPMGMTSVEVEIDGVKQKMNKGLLDVEIEIALIKDYEDRWANRPLFKFLRTLYDRYIIKDRIEKYEEKLIIEMDEFVNQTKAYLAMTGRR